MAEFKFLGLEEDTIEILDALLGTGKIWVTPDVPVEEKHIVWTKEPSIRSRELVESMRLLIFWLPGISYQPLEFRKRDEGPFAGKYLLGRSGAGPLMFLNRPSFFERNGQHYLNFGDLHHEPRFYDRALRNDISYPPEFKDLFKTLTGVIKKHCKTYGPKKYWVAKRARELLDQGKAKLWGT